MAATRSVRLAVFDCDGTLVDSQHSIVASMFAAFDAHAQPRPDAEAVRHVVGLPLREAIARLVPEGASADHGRLETSYVEAFRALRRAGEVDDPLYPGALEVLGALEAAGWVLGMATGKSSRGLAATLEAHGLAERFTTLQTADHGPGKPNPEMLLNAMTETGAGPANTVMIGDTAFDMEMARRAGAVAVGVSWGYHPEERLHAAGAHVIVHDFTELPETIEALGGARE